MGLLITSVNFVGKYAIPQSSFSDLDSFINEVEEDYLVDLLGSDLFADFKAKYQADPTFPSNPGYLKILNKFTADYGSKTYKSRGMAKMLMGFVFFEYMRNIKFKATTQGMVVNAADTSQPSGEINLYWYLNEATETHQSIQTYVRSLHPEQFPPQIAPTDIDFNGQEKGYAIPTFG